MDDAIRKIWYPNGVWGDNVTDYKIGMTNSKRKFDDEEEDEEEDGPQKCTKGEMANDPSGKLWPEKPDCVRPVNLPNYYMPVPELTEFQERVFQAVRKIPPDQTRTYGEVARSVGRPKGCRAVANALAKNPWPFPQCHLTRADGTVSQWDTHYVPCHRVVTANPKKPDVGYLGNDHEEAIDYKRRLREGGY
jgi:O-6-methylguanine DNA methyltransferase